jgi:hypothetical protein
MYKHKKCEKAEWYDSSKSFITESKGTEMIEIPGKESKYSFLNDQLP